MKKLQAHAGLSYIEIAFKTYLAQLSAEVKLKRISKDKARKLRQKLEKFIFNCQGLMGTVSFGTARDHATSKLLIAFAEALHFHLVEMELASANGYGDCGYMGIDFRARVKAWKGNFQKAILSPFVAVPLLFHGDSTEKGLRPSEVFPEITFLQKRKRRKRVIFCSPKHAAFSTRTDFGLLGLLDLLAIFFYPGGSGTFEEDSTESLARQLKTNCCTAYTDGEHLPIRFYLDHPVNNQGGEPLWFWDWKIMQIERAVTLGTIYDKDHSDAVFVRIGAKKRQTYKTAIITIEEFVSATDAARWVAEKVAEQKQLRM